MKKLLEYLIYLYLILIMFSGIIVKIISKNTILMSIKSILPDIILSLLIIICFILIIKRGYVKKTQNKDKYIYIYFTCVVILNLFFVNNYDDLLFALRDIYLPFAFLYLSQHIELSDKRKKIIYKNICKIFAIQVILGFVLAIFERYLGWQWTSSFYAGYEFYGKDPYIGIKIWQTNGILRVPSLAGDSTLFAFYNILSYLFIRNSGSKSKYILIPLAWANILLSTNKTALILIIIEGILFYIGKFKKSTKIIVSAASLVIFITILINLYIINDEFYTTFFIRWNNWSVLLKEFGFWDFIIPIKNIFSIGAGTEGFGAVIDNSYIYIFLAYGIVGVFLYCKCIYRMMFEAKRTSNTLLLAIIIIIIISGITTNIFQGRVLFTPFCIVYFLIMSKDNKKFKKIDKK